MLLILWLFERDDIFSMINGQPGQVNPRTLMSGLLEHDKLLSINKEEFLPHL
jgi:hypothetical protein